MPDISGLKERGLFTHPVSYQQPCPLTIKFLTNPPELGHSFEGISMLWSPLPDRAIKLFLSTSPKTVSLGFDWHRCTEAKFSASVWTSPLWSYPQAGTLFPQLYSTLLQPHLPIDIYYSKSVLLQWGTPSELFVLAFLWLLVFVLLFYCCLNNLLQNLVSCRVNPTAKSEGTVSTRLPSLQTPATSLEVPRVTYCRPAGYEFGGPHGHSGLIIL